MLGKTNAISPAGGGETVTGTITSTSSRNYLEFLYSDGSDTVKRKTHQDNW